MSLKRLERFASHVGESLGARSNQAEAPAPGTPAPSPEAGRTRNRAAGFMDIDKIVPDPSQPRQTFEKGELERLSMSIRRRGVQTNILVRWREDLGKWMLIFGERRWRAAQMAGLTQLPCVFAEGDLTESEILEQQMVENIQRSDLDPIERGRGFQRWLDLNPDRTKAQLAELLDVSSSLVSTSLALVHKLPEDIQEMVSRGELPANKAYDLTLLPDPEQQRELARAGKTTTLRQNKVSRTEFREKIKERGSGIRATKTSYECGSAIVTVAFPRQASGAEIEAALVRALELVRQANAQKGAA